MQESQKSEGRIDKHKGLCYIRCINLSKKGRVIYEYLA